MSDKNRLAKNLRLARVAKGLTQIQAAALVGKSRQTINAWEREDENAASPDDSDLDVLAKAYGTSRQELRYGETERVPDTRARSQPVREYLAEARLELVRGGLDDDQVERALVFIESEAWLDLWRAVRGSSPSRDLVIDGMRVGVLLARKAALYAALERLSFDDNTPEAQAEVLRLLALSPEEIGPPLAATPPGEVAVESQAHRRKA